MKAPSYKQLCGMQDQLRARVEETQNKSSNRLLYLYLPPTSTHTPGYIKGTVHGLIGWYDARNTYQKDNLYFVQMLYKHLLDRGWERRFIWDWVLDVLSEIETKGPKGSESSHPAANSCRLSFQLQYHPDNIPHSRVHEIHHKWSSTQRDRLLPT